MRANSIRTLVVEDEPTSQAAVAHCLKVYGPVEKADDGLIGLQKFYQALRDGSPFHLVTIDLKLPLIDGRMMHACMRGLELERKERIRARFMMLTAETEREAIMAVLADGVDGYLCKPFDPASLRTRVREMFRLPPPLQEARSLRTARAESQP